MISLIRELNKNVDLRWSAGVLLWKFNQTLVDKIQFRRLVLNLGAGQLKHVEYNRYCC